MCAQRHCNEGEEPQALVLKLISIKDSKQVRAHEGMKWVMSGESLKPEGVVALAGTAVMVAEAEATGIALTAYMVVAMMGAHSSGSLCVHLAAILAKDIYLL